MAVGNSGSEKRAKASSTLDFVQPFFVVVSIRVMHNRLKKEGLLVLIYCHSFATNMPINLAGSASRHTSVHCQALIILSILLLFSFLCFLLP